MGVFYGTDYISKLPIDDGEEVVVILLREKEFKMHHFPVNSYPDEIYTPVGIPIYGKFVEYGSVRDIENLEDVLDNLSDIRFNSEITEIINEDNITEFIHDIDRNEVKAECDGYKIGPIVPIFIKRNLYNRLMNYMKQRVYYKTKEPLCKTFKKSLFKQLDEVESYMKDKYKDKSEDFKYDRLCSKLSELPITCGGSILYYCDIVPKLNRKLYSNPSDEKAYAQLEEIVFFKYILDALHMGYFSITTSIDQKEMLIHREVAKYILEETEREKDKELEESIYDDESIEGVLGGYGYTPNI